MTTLSEEDKRALRASAVRDRNQFRKHQKGLPNTWGKPVQVSWWNRTESRLAWLLYEEQTYLGYKQLKKAMKEEGIQSVKKYNAEQKKHKNWHSAPQRYYSEWTSWRSLFGMPAFLSFKDLKKSVKKEKVTSALVYKKMRKHKNMASWPSNPRFYYKDVWISWFDFLSLPALLNMNELKVAVRRAGIKSHTQYNEQKKAHPGWPWTPAAVYVKGWPGWKDFLGSKGKAYKKRKAKAFISLPELRKAVAREKVDGQKKYQQAYKKHKDWPSAPNVTYSNWVSWGNLFGRKEFLSFSKLQKSVKRAKVFSYTEYQTEYNNRSDWPSSPEQTYSEVWVSWIDFFGLEKKTFLPMKEMLPLVRGLTQAQYLERRSALGKGVHWPYRPDTVYRSEWVSWDHFVGRNQ